MEEEFRKHKGAPLGNCLFFLLLLLLLEEKEGKYIN